MASTSYIISSILCICQLMQATIAFPVESALQDTQGPSTAAPEILADLPAILDVGLPANDMMQPLDAVLSENLQPLDAGLSDNLQPLDAGISENLQPLDLVDIPLNIQSVPDTPAEVQPLLDLQSGLLSMPQGEAANVPSVPEVQPDIQTGLLPSGPEVEGEVQSALDVQKGLLSGSQMQTGVDLQSGLLSGSAVQADVQTGLLDLPEVAPETAAHYVRMTPRNYAYVRGPKIIPPPVHHLHHRVPLIAAAPPHYYMYPRVYVRVPQSGRYWDPKFKTRSKLYQIDPNAGGYLNNLMPIFNKETVNQKNEKPLKKLDRMLNQPSTWVWPDKIKTGQIQIQTPNSAMQSKQNDQVLLDSLLPVETLASDNTAPIDPVP